MGRSLECSASVSNKNSKGHKLSRLIIKGIIIYRGVILDSRYGYFLIQGFSIKQREKVRQRWRKT